MSNSHGQIIVVGNEKGGSGKSTTAIHLIVGLLRAGHSVASVDLDGRQGSLTRFLALRQRFADKQGITLIQPKHETVPPVDGSEQSTAGGVLSDIRELGSLLRQLSRRCEAVVVDTAGSDSQRNRLAHTMADILITPLNDSFLDLDILATIDPDTMMVERPSHYAETVWQQRAQRAHLGLAATDWIVMRNRLSSLDAVSKRDMARLLDNLALRFGFRLLPGFGERVIFREMFLKGLTVMDIKDDTSDSKGLSASHLAARQEVENLVNAIHLKPKAASEAAPAAASESMPDEAETRAQP